MKRETHTLSQSQVKAKLERILHFLVEQRMRATDGPDGPEYDALFWACSDIQTRIQWVKLETHPGA